MLLVKLPFNSLILGAICFCNLVLICISCAEPEVGCLDALASNFDIEADQDCCLIEEECCCTFPSMSLNLFYKGTETDTLSDAATNIRLATYYPLENATDSIRIDSFSLFISNLQLISSLDSDTLQLFETLELSFLDSNSEEQVASFPDNIALVSIPTFSFDIGTFRSDIEYDEVSFDIGLRPELATIDPSSVDNGHPLGEEYTILFDTLSSRFLTGRIGFSLKRGVEERFFSQEVDSFISSSQMFLNSVAIEKGEDLDILMRINVLDIFKGIIFDVPIEDVGSIIDENLTSSISILE